MEELIRKLIAKGADNWTDNERRLAYLIDDRNKFIAFIESVSDATSDYILSAEEILINYEAEIATQIKETFNDE